MTSSLTFFYLELSGFMSFPSDKVQRLDLGNQALWTITGSNLDIEGEKNGCGKSAALESLGWCLFGKSPRISNQGFLNYIQSGPLLVVVAAQRNDIMFRVERGLNPDLLRLFEKPVTDNRDFRHKEGGKFIFEVSRSSKPETTKRIIELVGFDLKLTDILLMCNASDKSNFFLKTLEEQRNIVEQIFGFSEFTEKANQLREMRKEEAKNCTAKRSHLIATSQSNDRILLEISELEEKSHAWAAERDKLIRFVSQQINSYRSIDFDHEIRVLAEVDALRKQMHQVERDTKTQEQALAALTHQHVLWQTQHTKTISDLVETIQTLQNIDITAEIETIRQRAQIEQDVYKITTELQAAQRQQEPYRASLETEYRNRSKIAKQVEITEKQIMQLQEYVCPLCQRGDFADAKDHVLKSIAELDAQNAEIATIDATITTMKDTIRQIDNQIDKLTMRTAGVTAKLAELPATTFATIEEATEAGTVLREQQTHLAKTEQAENPHSALLIQATEQMAIYRREHDKLHQASQERPPTHYQTLTEATEARQNYATLQTQFTDLRENTENPYAGTILNLRTRALKPVDDTEVKELEKLVAHLDLLVTLLSHADSPIRQAVIQEYLPTLNEKIGAYCQGDLELPHEIVFDADMTPTFTLASHRLSYGNLSTGQKMRASLGVSLAMIDLWEMLHGRLGLLMVDEIADRALSARGARLCLEVLQRITAEKQKTVYLVTNRQELCDAAGDNTVLVEFQEGLSTIVH